MTSERNDKKDGKGIVVRDNEGVAVRTSSTPQEDALRSIAVGPRESFFYLPNHLKVSALELSSFAILMIGFADQCSVLVVTVPQAQLSLA